MARAWYRLTQPPRRASGASGAGAGRCRLAGLSVGEGATKVVLRERDPVSGCYMSGPALFADEFQGGSESATVRLAGHFCLFRCR